MHSRLRFTSRPKVPVLVSYPPPGGQLSEWRINVSGPPSFWRAGSRKAAERAKDAILLVGGERDGRTERQGREAGQRGRAERQGFGISILDLQHGTGSTCEVFSGKKGRCGRHHARSGQMERVAGHSLFWLRNFACWRRGLFAHWLGICLYLRREENCVHNRCLDGDLCGRGGAVAGCAVGHIPRGP